MTTTRRLPGDRLVPEAGDRYILLEYPHADEYYALAEEEYLTAVNRYNAENAVDVSGCTRPDGPRVCRA